ncbi:MAG: MarR family winged helix-turn-helix transcriptional regulator [Anaerovoracaceae bacterium]
MRDDIGYLLKSINDKLQVYANADMQKYGLTFPQSRVLAVLHSKGGEMTQKELESLLEVSHPTVVGLVSRMEKEGFLETRKDESDRRNKIITLTDKARSVGETLDRTVRDHNKRMLAGLTNEQVESLFYMLSVIENNIKR